MRNQINYMKNMEQGLTITGIDVRRFNRGDKSWISGFDEWWQGVAWEYLHENKVEANVLIQKYFDINCTGDLHDFEFEDKKILSAIILIYFDRIALAAQNDGSGWSVAGMVIDIYELLSHIDAGFNKHRVNARNAANTRHQETYIIKESLRVWHRNNRHLFLKNGKLNQTKAGAEAAKQEPISQKKAAEYMGEFEKEFLEK